MTDTPIFVLGGHQTDFAVSWHKRGAGLFEMMKAGVEGALASARVDPEQVEVAHIGNFAAELFGRQGQLGGLFASLHPAFDGIPAMRHEAACASGGTAILSACADLEAGRYGLACVVGIELERNVSGEQAAEHLGVAAWLGREAQDARYPWPHLFARLEDEYEARYGLDRRHLAAIAELNLENAKRNPSAQTRSWTFPPGAFGEDDAKNPIVEGRIRRYDCSQVTDGAAVLLLATRAVAEQWAQKTGVSLDRVPRILGFGHRTSPMLFEEKLKRSKNDPYVFPTLRRTILDGFERAGISNVTELDGIETHDCFTITEYMAIDHFGITPPGRSFEALEQNLIGPGGKLPINPSGGLIGGGHPVGASGVRMVLDAAKQVSGRAGDYQVPNARRFGTLNIGGTATTVVSFVIGR